MRRTFLVLIVMLTALVAASGVALAVVRFGGPGNDTLIGTNGDDRLGGHRGNDTLVGLDGVDLLIGGLGHDDIYGGPDRDFVVGWGGDDVLFGGDGRDEILGDAGADTMFGGDGSDTLIAWSFERKRDWLFCGSGTDHYSADKIDYVSSTCEVKEAIVRVD
jgi:Ca2+-binding RTX toxin-like protein